MQLLLPSPLAAAAGCSKRRMKKERVGISPRRRHRWQLQMQPLLPLPPLFDATRRKPPPRYGVAQKTQRDEEVIPSSSRCSLLFSRCPLLVAALAAAAAAVVAIMGVSSCRCNCCCHFHCRRSGCEGGWMWWTWIGTWVWCPRCFVLL